MAKSKEQKRTEALARLNTRIEQQSGSATILQQLEQQALTQPASRPRSAIEQIFGIDGDPVTGMIYAHRLPEDFRPTPELDEIVHVLSHATERFVEITINLETPEGYAYATYEGTGTYLDQWVRRHTKYIMHHAKNLYGVDITVVFSLENELPEYNAYDELINGTTKEMYERSKRVSL